MEARFAIGTKFRPVRKHAYDCEVVDILTTTNSKGEVVKIRYVATHQFCGQTITDSDVCHSTIARGLVEKELTQ